MRRYIGFFVLIALALFTLGCNQREVAGDEKTAKEFIEGKGYRVTSLLGQLDQYNLTKNMLYGQDTLIYRQIWGVQASEPDRYFGKEISVYGFIVSKHPLEKQYNAKTRLYIMLTDGKVIGGYSFPDIEGLVGSVYSLEGKTLEEVTGLTFTEWREKWIQKYGD
ncbi:hypothetical protein ACE3NQ_13445 [Paenibacillus terreus]|uniref:DUF4830 domain-containing protein n=1 Tax=Paenibacillus terreus TaxID=1387834 RepID=A0ABV5B891_9BACL